MPLLAGLAVTAAAAPGSHDTVGGVFHPPAIAILPEAGTGASQQGPAPAFLVGQDGAGVETRDTASGGPGTGGFVHMESAAVCGLACRVPAGDDELWAFCPPAGDPDLPFHWTSGTVTQGLADCTDFAQGTVFLDTNGYLAFQDPGVVTLSSTGIPSTATPNGIVAVDWQDLDASVTFPPDGLYSGIAGAAPNRVLYLEWWNVPHYLSACGQQVEAALFEADHRVEVYYLSDCATFAAAGGEENSGGQAGTSYFSGAPPSNVGVRYKDVRAPSVSASVACGIAGSNGWCRSATNSFTLTDNGDAGTSVGGLGVAARTFTLDGGASQAYTSGAASTRTLADGSHPLVATATDWASNAGTANTALKVDGTPPTVGASSSCDTPGTNGWCRGTVTTTTSASDAASGVASTTCTRDGAGVACGTISTTAQGAHTVAVSATDNAGNTAGTNTGFQVDSVAPSVSIVTSCSGGTSNGWCRGTLTATTSTSDATSGLATTTCDVDGALVACGTLTFAAEGTRTLTLRATDRAGNQATTQAVLRVDQTPPAVSLATTCAVPGSAGWCRGTVTATTSASDGVSGVATQTCVLDAAAVACGTLSVAAQGHHTLTLTATDTAGNTATTTAAFDIDSVAPTLALSSSCAMPGTAGWCRSAITVQAVASDATSGLAGFSCTLDGAAAGCASITVTTEGRHTVAASATDRAGNQASASANAGIDTVPPAMGFSLEGTAGDHGWWRSAVSAGLACTDNTSGVDADRSTLGVDGGAPVGGDPTLTIEGDGHHVAAGACEDLAGNQASGTQTVDIDTVPPAGLVRAPTLVPGAFDVAWSASDATSGLAVLAMEERAFFGVLAGFRGVCLEDLAGFEADGSCARDPIPGQYCYRVVLRDVAGNTLTTATADLADDPATLVEHLTTTCTLASGITELPPLPAIPDVPPGDGTAPQAMAATADDGPKA